jgi:hypothetical protein
VLTGAARQGIRNVFDLLGITTLWSQQEDPGVQVSNTISERASFLNAIHPPHGYNIYVEM